MYRILTRFALIALIALPQASSAVDAPGIAPPDAALVAKVAKAVSLTATPSIIPVFSGKSSAVFALQSTDSTLAGYVCLELDSSGARVAEVILDRDAGAAFTRGAEASAQRAIGVKKALGTPIFSHDGLLSYNLLYPYTNKETGRSEGKVAIDVLAGRLSLPSGKSAGRIELNSTAPAADARILAVPHLKMHTSYRATTLAMLFSNLSAGGFPQVGKKKVKGVEQTDAQYIEDFSKACGACSERSATEIFITDRGMMADIGTYRVSGESPKNDLADIVLSELDHNRAVYARVSVANVNHYLVICGYVNTPQGLFLIARLPAGEDSTDTAGGYAAFALPAYFDSAEFVTVALRKDK